MTTVRYGKVCVCGRGGECQGISAAFALLRDPRRGYVELPPYTPEPRTYLQQDWNAMRAAFLRNLGRTEMCLEVFSTDLTLYVALHHFHPTVVKKHSQIEDTMSPIPRSLQRVDVKYLKMNLTDEDRIRDEQGRLLKTYYFVPTWPIEKSKEDLKLLVKIHRLYEESVTRSPIDIPSPSSPNPLQAYQDITLENKTSRSHARKRSPMSGSRHRKEDFDGGNSVTKSPRTPKNHNLSISPTLDAKGTIQAAESLHFDSQTAFKSRTGNYGSKQEFETAFHPHDMESKLSTSLSETTEAKAVLITKISLDQPDKDENDIIFTPGNSESLVADRIVDKVQVEKISNLTSSETIVAGVDISRDPPEKSNLETTKASIENMTVLIPELSNPKTKLIHIEGNDGTGSNLENHAELLESNHAKSEPDTFDTSKSSALNITSNSIDALKNLSHSLVNLDFAKESSRDHFITKSDNESLLEASPGDFNYSEGNSMGQVENVTHETEFSASLDKVSDPDSSENIEIIGTDSFSKSNDQPFIGVESDELEENITTHFIPQEYNSQPVSMANHPWEPASSEVNTSSHSQLSEGHAMEPFASITYEDHSHKSMKEQHAIKNVASATLEDLTIESTKEQDTMETATSEDQIQESMKEQHAMETVKLATSDDQFQKLMMEPSVMEIVALAASQDQIHKLRDENDLSHSSSEKLMDGSNVLFPELGASLKVLGVKSKSLDEILPPADTSPESERSAESLEDTVVQTPFLFSKIPVNFRLAEEDYELDKLPRNLHAESENGRKFLISRIKKFESLRREFCKQLMDELSLRWTSSLEVMNAGILEVARAERIIRGAALASKEYAKAIQAIQADVFIDSNGNTVHEPRKQRRIAAERTASGAAYEFTGNSPERLRDSKFRVSMMSSLIASQEVIAEKYTENHGSVYESVILEIASLLNSLQKEKNMFKLVGDACIRDIKASETEVKVIIAILDKICPYHIDSIGSLKSSQKGRDNFQSFVKGGEKSGMATGSYHGGTSPSSLHGTADSPAPPLPESRSFAGRRRASIMQLFRNQNGQIDGSEQKVSQGLSQSSHGISHTGSDSKTKLKPTADELRIDLQMDLVPELMKNSSSPIAGALRSTFLVTDGWIIEMWYREAVNFQILMLRKLGSRLESIWEEMKNIEVHRKKKLHEALLDFMPRQRRLYLGLGSISSPVIKDLLDNRADPEKLKEDFETDIRRHMETLLKGDNAQRSHIMNRSRAQVPNLNELHGMLVGEFFDNGLLRVAKVVERQTLNVLSMWKTTLVVVTNENYLHLFDVSYIPEVKVGSPAEPVFELLLPDYFIPSTEDKAVSRRSTSLLKSLTPLITFDLFKCSFSSTEDPRITEITELYNKSYIGFDSRKLVLRLSSSVECKQWLSFLRKTYKPKSVVPV